MKNYFWHRLFIFVLRYTGGPFVKLRMRYRCSKRKGPSRPTLVIANHNTDLDPALVALGFSRHMYFVASEHALRGGFMSKLLKFIFDPVPINKVKTDLSAVKDIIRRLKAGASVCLFAEGDRSFNGVTGPISMSTAKLVRTSGADLVTFRIEGGYFTTPRWASSRRKGRMSGGVVREYTAGELSGMSNVEILDAIARDIHEDAYARQQEMPVRYRCGALAENIETALYLCPGCKKIGTIKSEGDRLYCGCGLDAVYTDTGSLVGGQLPFSTVTQWDIWQTEQLGEVVRECGNAPICADENQRLYEIDTAVGKTFAGEGEMRIDRDSFHCAGFSFDIGEIAQFAVTGQMTLHFGLKNGATYEVQTAAPRSALKYREIFRYLSSR